MLALGLHHARVPDATTLGYSVRAWETYHAGEMNHASISIETHGSMFAGISDDVFL